MSPKLIILFSGKRKSGKDFLAEHLLQHVGSAECQIIRISEPIKAHWARRKGLNLLQLLGDGPYKERYRKEMIEWSDEVRLKQPAFFCQEAFSRATKPIVIVSDIRRRTDIAYFRQLIAANPDLRLVTIRVQVDDMVRVRRGWTFQQGIDDVASECDLDEHSDWDAVLNNDGVSNGGPSAGAQLAAVMAVIEECRTS